MTRRVLMRSARPTGDSGTVMLLVIGLVAIAVSLIAVVTDVSSLWLTRRSLGDAADAAAIAAAQAVDLDAVYGGTTKTARDGVAVLPLDRTQVRTRVMRYVRDAKLASSFSHFQVMSVRTDGDSVVVVLKARARPPFMSMLSDFASSDGAPSDGVDISVEAHARLALG